MPHIKRTFFLFVFAALLLGACQPLVAPESLEPTTIPETFVTGAPVRLAVALAVGPDDNVYVSTQWVRAVLVLDPETGAILKSVGPEEGVDIPADLAFGPDGSLYIGMYPGFEGDAVARLAPDGTVTGTPLPPVIWPVMTTRDGRVFAGLLLENDVIVELDPEFQTPPRELLRDGVFIHLREGPDGLIYALKWFDGEIVRFDPDAPENVETVATGLTLPFNLAFDSAGQFYIIVGVDETTDAVVRLDLATGAQEVLATAPHLLYGLAFDSNDRLFVSSVDDGAVFEVLPKGGTRVVSPGGMILPSAVAVIARSDGESLFLADWGAWREYDTATGELRSSRHGTWWPGALTNPDTVAPFDGKLLLASSENQQIQLWDPVQQQEALLIDYPGANNAIGFDGGIIATSFETKDVARLDPANPAARTVLAADLAYPLGLAAEAGDLYVGDFLTGQIWQVAAAGVTLDAPALVAEGLEGPEGMALTGDGRLLVVESGADRLSIIDLASGQSSALVTNLGLLSDVPRSRPLHYFFNGVAISPTGTIYVTADGPNVIYRLTLPPREDTPSAGDAAALVGPMLDDIVTQIMADYPSPGFELCVVRDGQVVYNKGFGLADVDEARPVTPQSAMLQGSVTKALTAMAVMQLAEQERIDLDAPVTAYLPAFTMADQRYQDITMRMLLAHRAGLPDSPAIWPEPLAPGVDGLQQVLDDLSGMRLLYAPGADWRYSSYGYSVLGALITAVTGQPYADYMQEAWLAPLGMSHATFVEADIDPALHTTLYHGGTVGPIVATPTACDGRDTPACSLWASCDDMAKWAQFMLDGGEIAGQQLLEPATIDAMWSPLSTTYWGATDGAALEKYGMGWFVGEQDGHRLVGHLGLGDGLNTQFLLAPDDGLAVIAMENWMDPGAMGAGWPATVVAVQAMETLLGVE